MDAVMREFHGLMVEMRLRGRRPPIGCAQGPGRIMAMRRRTWAMMSTAAALLPLLATGCGSKGDATATDSSVSAIPVIAPSMPPATQDPAAAERFRTFAGIDADGNGYISAAENAAGADSLFDTIDADGDGTITVTELDAARRAMHLTPSPSSADLIARADQDGDGRLTLAEWIAMRGRDFTAADKDGDGRLSREEWQNMFRLETSIAAPAPNPVPSATR
jgi:hypothetical protein